MSDNYKLTYTYTGQSNISGKAMEVAFSNFKLSGDTDKPYAGFYNLTFSHYHSMTNTTGWYFFVRLIYSDGTYLDSSITSTSRFDGSVKKIVNKWPICPDIEKIQNISSIQIWTKSYREGSEWSYDQTIYNGELYWRATSSNPMELSVEFTSTTNVCYGVNGAWEECEVFFGVNGQWTPNALYYDANNVKNRISPYRRKVFPSGTLTEDVSEYGTASASSTNTTSYNAYKAFNFDVSSAWASSTSDSTPWIQIQLPEAVSNVVVGVYSRKSTYPAGPCAGKILASNDGSTWTEIGSFSGWDGSKSGVLLGEVVCNNETAYSYIRLSVSEKASGMNYVAIGYLEIRAES